MSEEKVVYLVNAGNDPGMASVSNDYSFPPLGVLALGSWLKERIPEVEVVVRDGGVHSMDAIGEDLYEYNPWLVGVSVLGTSYQNALQIAEEAKCFGTTTVFGNDQAAQLARNGMKNRLVVDYVVGSEYGEEALEHIVRYELMVDGGVDPRSLPHVTYSDGEPKGFDYDKDKSTLSILQSSLGEEKSRRNVLDSLPIVDRTLYPESHWQTYLENYLSKFAGYHVDPQTLARLKKEFPDDYQKKVIEEAKKVVTGVSTMNRARGCSRAKEEVKCKHCDMFLDPTFSTPEMFWEEARSAYEQVGANVLYEVCDSLSSFPKFVGDVAKSRPDDLGFDPQFFVYAQALDLIRNPDMIKQFQDIGVFRVNVGLESGSDRTLKHMKGRHDSVDTNYRALRMLKDSGIYVYGSLVLGTEKETQETLRETVDWAKTIVDEGLVADIEAQPILPLPNNYYGRQLYSKGLFPGGEASDWPVNTDIISKIYVDTLSGVNHDDAIEAVKEVREHAREKGINFGSGASRESQYA